MKLAKKILAGVLSVALLAGAVVGGGLYMKKSNQKTVLVVRVDSLASDYYMQDTSLEGQISTNVSQKVSFDEDMIIEEVYVQEGQAVKIGDPLMSFDMTLVQMELNIAKLKRQRLQNELDEAVTRLNSLKNGGPIVTSGSSTSGSSSSGTLDSSDWEPVDSLSDLSSMDGQYLAAVQPVILAAAMDGLFDDGLFGDGTEDTFTDESSEGAESVQPELEPEDPVQSDPDGSTGDDFSSEAEVTTPTPTPSPALGDDSDDFISEELQEELDDIHDGEDTFYHKLDASSIPFQGTGTEEDPFVFLCCSGPGKVVALGSFLNWMAGYNQDGTQILKEGGYWFRLEFHQNDKIANYQDLKESCIGYYLVNGSMLEEPVDMFVELEFTLEGASQYTQDVLPEDPSYDDTYVPDGSGAGSASISRADAIKAQQTLVQTLELDVRQSDLEILKLEKKVSKQIVYSKLDGTVSYVGDPITGTYEGEGFVTVESEDGFYVTGAVSELMLDQVEEGTILNCSSYESGSFEAEVINVSEYPISSGNYYGSGNPNVSHYLFSATISDKSLMLSDSEWLNITLQSDVPQAGSIVLPKAFVRTEDGVSFVYKDDNGVLKKQILDIGGNTDGGYSVLVNGGITREDRIAFPYGKTVKDGAITKEGTLDELYGY